MRLSNSRYEELKEEVAYVYYDYGITKVGIDVFELAEMMNITIIYASDKKSLNAIQILNHPDSFLYYCKEEQRFYVYIDDLNTGVQRQRFSLAHEIMHIRLGHTEQNEKNETEANFCAQYLLVPTSLILLDPDNVFWSDIGKIKKVFNVSEPVASKAMQFYRNRKALINIEVKPYEKLINDLVKTSIKKKIKNKKV